MQGREQRRCDAPGDVADYNGNCLAVDFLDGADLYAAAAFAGREFHGVANLEVEGAAGLQLSPTLIDRPLDVAEVVDGCDVEDVSDDGVS